MKNILFVVLLLISALSGAANLKQQADEAFAAEDYAKAEKLYLKLASQGESSHIYYNLGCTYYRMDNMAKAVLWLERAYILNPGDDDIQFNLDMARNKTIDRITPRHEMFFISAWNSLSRQLSITQWAVLALVSFVVSLLLLATYIFCSRIVLRKVGFFGFLIFMVGCIFFNILAYSQRSYNLSHTAGVIMSPAVTVKSTPSQSGTDLFVIHEGTRIEIKDNEMKEWAEVKIADGKVGWIKKSTFEEI